MRRRVASVLHSLSHVWVLAALLSLATAPTAWGQGSSVSVSPTSGDPGAPLTVTGSGWTVNDSVEVDIGGAQACRLVADASGSISGNRSNGCQVPAGLAAGSEPLTAQDPTVGTNATGTPFTVTPSASFTAPSSVAYGSQVNVDASGSQGVITKYLWDFGDSSTSSATTPTANHAYSRVGSYVITLTVVDSSGNTDSVDRTVSVTGSPPTASFSPPAAQPTGTSFNFDGTASSTPNAGATITSLDWNWGDGTPDGSGPKPSHTYASAGSYTVTLTVTDSAGETSAPVSHTVTVADRPPTAAFNPTAATVLAGSPVLFDGTLSDDPDGPITGISWKFGDGGSSSQAKPTHTYFSLGTFNVTLTVTDAAGNSSSVTHQVTVIAPPPVQTLILTPVASPTIVRSTRASATHGGPVDLGLRLFCPGPGPGCSAFILATSKSLLHHAHGARGHRRAVAGTTTIMVGPNGSAEAAFRLFRRALALLRAKHRLPVRVQITVLRGDQTSTRTLTLTLVAS